MTFFARKDDDSNPTRGWTLGNCGLTSAVLSAGINNELKAQL